jgi:nucleoside-diphosphate-sugar epimerase
VGYLEAYSREKVLVTGGAGLIGSNLVRRLTEIDVDRVFVLDNLSSSFRWNIPESPKVVFVEGDVCDEGLLKRIFLQRPRYVFHMAAHFANQKAVENPEENLRVNGLGTLKLLEWSQAVQVDRFVLASAGCSAYGSRAPVPLKEDFITLNLDTPYQIHKLLGELYSNWFRDYWGLPTVRLRLFNVFGPGGLPGRYKNVIPNFMYRALQGEPLPVMGSGRETRDFTFISDIVDGLLRAGIVPEAVGEAMNIGSGRETTSADLADAINKVTGNEGGIEIVGKRDWDKSNRRVASIDKARSVLGYDPTTGLEEGLEKTRDWFVENKQRIVFLES